MASRLFVSLSNYNSVLKGAYLAITGLTGYGVYSWTHSLSASASTATSDHDSVVQKIEEIRNAFIHSQPLESADAAVGICGRIKYMKPNELTTLSHPINPFSWVFGSDGLFMLSQCSTHYDMCMQLGLERSWVETRLRNGDVFTLLLFPQSSSNYTAVCADWDGVFSLLQSEEPECFAKLESFKSELIHTPFEDIEAKSDFEFIDVSYRGSEDDRYLTKERFLNIDDDALTLVDCRLFLYCHVGLSKYYDGDGYTVEADGKRGCKEYVVRNMKLDEIKTLTAIPLNVRVPST